ncbi:Fe-S cluster assembly protein SufD [Alkalilimnicola ehrlichii MLHE-1]|uniref:Iron-regulated ABC transporter permease protein SufD n=1 Tax=Alkalilimnicola ehrlichii (strain ATCC BAA-1101 / DSM 17681 / MLHE-1) TaxID=187272 RepID=Q0AAQ6_ALKEH|nr:Fe-S cluster assembly protein SufD [Alkalilimnicola ehrlichii]ABI56081.1 Iron-regulated ABC transporter permease protein SufD [Alkalilimnicola ehrlichii MLHE-1]
MEALAEKHSIYLEDFRQRPADQQGPDWLEARRQAAIEAFERMGFPTRRWEAWRNIKLDALLQHHYRPAETLGVAPQVLQEAISVAPDAPRLVFIDGVFSPQHSTPDALPEGLTVKPLSEALDEADVQQHLAAHADYEQHPFIALNTAFARQGVYVHVPRGQAVEQEVLFIFACSDAGADRASWPRVLVHAEESAECRLIEWHGGPDGSAYLASPVTEIIAEANANVRLDRLQREGADAFHLGAVHAEADRDARVHVQNFNFGGRISRVDYYGLLKGTAAEVIINGLYLGDRKRFTDQHTWMTHDCEHGHSSQLFKGILKDKAEAVFDGLLKVEEGAQKTDGFQENRNLILSPMALAHSNPRLEIYADDVKCSHGSTVGELDKEAVFYLRSRGMDQDSAQALLTWAFANEVLSEVRLDSLKTYQQRLLGGFLPGQADFEGLV